MVEGFFATAFRSGLQPVELAKRILREMDAGKSVGVKGVWAPNHFVFTLSSEDAELRVTAVRALGKLAAAEHREPIVERLRDPAWFVRAAAARALQSSGEDAAVDDALGQALRDSEWWVRANAARSLARRGETGVARLAAALEGDDRYARDAALSALASPAALSLAESRLRPLAAAHPEDPVLVGLFARARTLQT